MRPYLWPKETPQHTTSVAEKKVYEPLKSGLLEGWHGRHSLRLRSRTSGQFDETDFVIGDTGKPALLVIEVKGGQIEISDGRWYQNGHLMDSPPLNQALAFRSVPIDRLRDLKVDVPKIGCAVCFPDTIFEKGPSGDDLRRLVIGEKDLPYLKEVLPVRAIGKC
jgi:hypothetical protein